MAIATKRKPKTVHHKKRVAGHHRQTKHYIKSYWPYLPITAIVALGIFVNSVLSHPSAVLGEKTNLTQTALLSATNDSRQNNHALPLAYDNQLQQAAQRKAEDMAQKDYWSHATPDGQQPWNFVTDSGYQYQAAGENLAYGFTSAETVMTAWMQSPDHRANVLSDNFSQVGFGVAQSADYLGEGPKTIIVAMYALPTSAGSSIPLTTVAPDGAAPVSRVQTLVGSQISAFIVGVVGTLAVLAVLFRHGFAWRRLLNRGEMFVIEHPVLDVVLVSVVVLAVLLNQTAGFIR